jgi:hypothetical protein
MLLNKVENWIPLLFVAKCNSSPAEENANHFPSQVKSSKPVYPIITAKVTVCITLGR